MFVVCGTLGAGKVHFPSNKYHISFDIWDTHKANFNFGVRRTNPQWLEGKDTI